MKSLTKKLETLLEKKSSSSIWITTLGKFQVHRNGTLIPDKEWGRDKTTQLFQYLVTARKRNGLHKEQIISRIWEDAGQKDGDRDFKVALHGINKVLEPKRKSRTEAKYIIRQGLTYQLNMNEIWLDVDELDGLIVLANEALHEENKIAKKSYKAAVELFNGVYLPNRIYEDWTSAERERIQMLAIGAHVTLAELLLKKKPMESIRLAQEALQRDPTWEDAYRIQMLGYIQSGNRPQALKTYKKCKKILHEEFGIEPLPETRKLLEKIESL